MTGRYEITSPSALIKANLLTALGMFLFSISLPILEELVQRYSITTVAAARNLAAGGFLILLGLAVENRKQMTRAYLKRALQTGAVWYLITMLCLTYAISFAGAFSTAVILSLIPVVSAIINVIEGKDKIGPRLAIALVLSIMGSVFSTVGFSASGISLGLGELVLLIGVIAWVLMTRSVDTHLAKAPQTLSIGIVIFTPGVLLGIAAIFLHGVGIEASGLVNYDPEFLNFDLTLFFVLAIVSSAGSMVLWFKSVEWLGMTIASLQQNLVPVFVLMQVWWIGHDTEWIKIIGGVLVVIGAVIAQMRQAKPKTG